MSGRRDGIDFNVDPDNWPDGWDPSMGITSEDYVNRKFKKGGIVDYHSEIGGPITRKNCIIQSSPWIIISGKFVIKISGVESGVSLNAISFPDMPDIKPNCRTCKHVRNVPGDAHKRCANSNANVEGAEIGIRKGYFSWPYNFDPRWLVNCDGYEKKEE